MHKPENSHIEAHLEALIGERNPHSSPETLAKAARYVSRHFESSGLKVREENVPFEGEDSVNILGLKPGATPDSPPFILAAHFDTVEKSPGADDNASAVAALLETARCLQPLRLFVPLLFAGFTLEEYGFVGSSHFLTQAIQRGESICGMISLEMVGYRDSKPGSQTYPPYIDPALYPDTGDFIAVVGNEPSGKLTHAIADGMQGASPDLKVERLVVPGRGDQFREVTLSDHSPFWENGIPAVMVTDTAFLRNPHYHQPTDTMETLDIDFIRETTQGILGFLAQHLS